MGARRRLRAVCLLLVLLGAGAATDTNTATPAAEGGAAAAAELSERGAGDSSEVLQKRFVIGSPAANSYSVGTDVSFLITFVFNMVFLSMVTLAVASAAQQAGVAASSRRRSRLDPAPLERRSAAARHRRRHAAAAAAATLPPDTVNAIVEHVSGPTAAATASPAASDSFGDYSDYERYPSRFEEPSAPAGQRFQPSSVDDILDYLYQTDRSLYDELRLRVADRPPPPVRGARDREYAQYLASVYGYGGTEWERAGLGGTEDGRGALTGDRVDWQTEQEAARRTHHTAQRTHRTADGPGLSGKVPYEKRDPLGAPLKYRQR